MEQWKEELEKAFEGGLMKLVLSNPKKDYPYRRVVFVRKKIGFQRENYTDTQVFHENLTAAKAFTAAAELFGESYKQMNGTGEDVQGGFELEYRFSKGGKVFGGRKSAEKTKPQDTGHNRTKKYLIPEGSPLPALQDMGIFTKEGKVVNSMQDKFRQINRFAEMVDDGFDALPTDRPIHIIDFGCGKSYLTFILYYYFTEIKKREVRITGLDLKKDVIENCNRAAKRYGYENLHFQAGDVKDFVSDTPVDMVVTLHACDTATDYALAFAIKQKASLILSVPCCQHELNKQMKTDELTVLTRYGIVKERTAALLTDAIRADLITASGYKTQILEFVDMSHTPKNLLIRATKCFQPVTVKRQMLAEVKRATEAFSVKPTLQKLLEEEQEQSK